MKSTPLHRIKTISEYHQLMGLPRPEHPLISVINLEAFKDKTVPVNGAITLVYDFYCIALKRSAGVKFRYGQQKSDFNEGVLFFIAPGQVVGFEIDLENVTNPSGWIVFIHPDFLWNTALAKNIKRYEYFDYSVNESLFLSAKEEKMIIRIIKNIREEYLSRIDKFSEPVIIAQLELLLTFADRFYQRQFITRKISNHAILHRLDAILTEYFNNDSLLSKGLPSVPYLSEKLNVSPSYLSRLLKTLTGLSTQQHIHVKLVEKAKEKLSTTNLSVSEIAYELGFKYPQSFSKLFKAQTSQSPLEFRAGFS